MQLYAQANDGQSIAVDQAMRGYDYKCFECGGLVRLREGRRRQRHYYHLRRSSLCRQQGKGIVHLQVQRRLLQALPSGEASLEERFPAIGRIADVAWHSQHIVFEVQCASMSVEEALARTADYQRVGWQVVWILHRDRYRRRHLTPLEECLVPIPHYFTDIDVHGEGIIYDQVAIYRYGKRLASTPPRKVAWQVMQPTVQTQAPVPQAIALRSTHWPLHLADDYLTVLHDAGCWAQLLAVEHRHESAANAKRGLWQRCFMQPYLLLLQYVLESCCKR